MSPHRQASIISTQHSDLSMIQKSRCSSLFAALLLLTPACMHRRKVVFEHDTLTGRDTMTYRGKAISPEELFDLGEKADFDQIDPVSYTHLDVYKRQPKFACTSATVRSAPLALR